MSDYKLNTKCVQGGYTPGNGEPRQIPIIQSTTFKYDTSEAMGRLFDLEDSGYFYTRLQNPTNDMVAAKIAELEGGTAAMLTSSGQAANFFALFNICECGSHIVASSSIYGGTFNLIEVTMKKMGIDVTFVSPDCSEAELDAAFQENTRVVFGETIANPALTVLDIEKFAKAAHAHGVPLIVDEAHGAHFRFSDYFPVSAAQLGADVVINSVHKTLPCLTQTGVIHLCSERVSREKLKRFLGIYQSSSPSYILMSSIDACMDKLEREGDEMFQVFTDNLEKARERLGKCKYIRLVTPEVCECQRVFDFDRSKILLSTVNSSLNGRQLHQILREEFHLEMEMEAENYVLALAAVGDTAEGFRRLCEAVEEIDRRESLKCKKEAEEEEPLKNGKMKQMMRISQAMDAESERCALEECIGRTSVEFAYLYPPGIPLIVPGEQISGHFVKNVRRYLEQGFEVQGLSDQTSETVCVVKNET